MEIKNKNRGYTVKNWIIPPFPQNIILNGTHVLLSPLSASKHAKKIFQQNKKDIENSIWNYLPYGPFNAFDDYLGWVSSVENSSDPYFFAIERKDIKEICGVASYLRIKPDNGSIEVGHINFSPLLQNTIAATEAMYLMMKWVFEKGYRRYEWKCNALNIKSRKAAQRLGFSYEGIFRQASVEKNRNRDTAWFAVIDKEWVDLEKCFEFYLNENNFDKKWNQKTSLSSITKKILYKIDNFEGC